MQSKYLHFVKLYDDFENNLGPHAVQILKELTNSIKYENYLTIVILSATLFDIIKNENSEAIRSLSGIEINSVFSSREAMWLRQRRNEIIHHEGATDGMLGSKSDITDLSLDAKKSIKILYDLLRFILK
jgi:hypothetical protein